MCALQIIFTILRNKYRQNHNLKATIKHNNIIKKQGFETRFTNGSAEFDVHSGAEKSDKGTNDPNHKGKSGRVCITNYCGLKYFIVKQGLMFVREEI